LAAVSPHVISIVRLLRVDYEMKIDVLIKYDGSDVIIKSEIANYSETRPAIIGLSRERNNDFEQVEYVGEQITTAEMEQDA